MKFKLIYFVRDFNHKEKGFCQECQKNFYLHKLQRTGIEPKTHRFIFEHSSALTTSATSAS